MSVTLVRPRLSRRSIIAAASGLAVAGCLGKFGLAQMSESALPDAADAMTQIMPQAAPRLAFSNEQGKKRTLADYAGQALVVNLWATWCGPCVAEIPSFDALAPKLKASGVLVLPISIDLTGAAAVRPFYTAHNIHSLPILLDPSGHDLQLLGSDGIPITLIINPAGQMVAQLEGAANWNTPRTMKFLTSLGGKTSPGAADNFIPA